MSYDVWQHLPEASAHAIVTSPPYFGLRDYGTEAQIGLESTPAEYVEVLANTLDGWGRHVMRDDGSLWLNLGDSYSSRSGWSRDPNDTSGLDGSSQRAWDNQPERYRGATSQVAATRNARAAGDGDHPPKCMLMIPERVALAMIDRGWILRNRVVWSKPNGMPSSVTDRLATKHEALFHFARERFYYYDLDAIREPHIRRWTPGENGQRYDGHVRPRHGTPDNLANAAPHEVGANPGDVWEIPTQPYPEAHFAVFPPELVRRPILATVPEGGVVCDPFAGAGTTAVMARRLGRRSLLCELNPTYCDMIAKRTRQGVLL